MAHNYDENDFYDDRGDEYHKRSYKRDRTSIIRDVRGKTLKELNHQFECYYDFEDEEQDDDF